MVQVYRTPGVYVEEIATLPPSVAEVATAVPAFIGYTQTGPADTADPVTLRVTSLLQFETAFGGSQPAKFNVVASADGLGDPSVQWLKPTNDFSLHPALDLYFKNGGGPCYVVSVGNFASTPSKDRFSKGLAALEKEDEPTLIVLTDAACLLKPAEYYDLCRAALMQCKQLGDRFTVLDVIGGDSQGFRNDSSLSANLSYGAAYHPYLQTLIGYQFSDVDVSIIAPTVSGTLLLGEGNAVTASFTGPAGSKPTVVIGLGDAAKKITFAVNGVQLTLTDVNAKIGSEVVKQWVAWKKTNPTNGFDLAVSGDGSAPVATADKASTALKMEQAGTSLESIRSSQTALYNKVKTVLSGKYRVLPPSAAIAGIYARVDREHGVWKAPANVGVLGVLGPIAKVTNAEQDGLNIDATAGKSINVIRAFTGKGTLVWGARTLAGNDNEWRYVSVRRLFITIEESARKASAFAVFEPNDQATWLKVKAMIESYLYSLWERGALAGAKPESAYYVHVGLGTTMTPQDVLEGRMLVDVGVAAVRPAEFIVLRFSHKMQTA